MYNVCNEDNFCNVAWNPAFQAMGGGVAVMKRIVNGEQVNGIHAEATGTGSIIYRTPEGAVLFTATPVNENLLEVWPVM